jgi:hypothetical protein
MPDPRRQQQSVGPDRKSGKMRQRCHAPAPARPLWTEASAWERSAQRSA